MLRATKPPHDTHRYECSQPDWNFG